MIAGPLQRTAWKAQFGSRSRPSAVVRVCSLPCPELRFCIVRTVVDMVSNSYGSVRLGVRIPSGAPGQRGCGLSACFLGLNGSQFLRSPLTSVSLLGAAARHNVLNACIAEQCSIGSSSALADQGCRLRWQQRSIWSYRFLATGPDPACCARPVLPVLVVLLQSSARGAAVSNSTVSGHSNTHRMRVHERSWACCLAHNRFSPLNLTLPVDRSTVSGNSPGITRIHPACLNRMVISARPLSARR
jgi:hypothetical protein